MIFSGLGLRQTGLSALSELSLIVKCFPSSGERTEHHHESGCVFRQFHLHPLHPLRPPERLCEHPVPLRVWTQLHAWMMGFKDLIVTPVMASGCLSICPDLYGRNERSTEPLPSSQVLFLRGGPGAGPGGVTQPPGVSSSPSSSTSCCMPWASTRADYSSCVF